MKILNLINKIMNPIFKIYGAIIIITGLLYLFDVVKPEYYKFDLLVYMFFTAIVFLFSKYTPKKEKERSIFETKDGHLDLNNACTEIAFLYKTYGLESDENLTEDAKELKKRILTVVDTIKNL
jgi:hypothetical protein